MSLKLLLISVLISQVTSQQCPSRCSCYLDHKGRKTVSCVKGGMVGPVNLDGVGLDTEIIKISAPEDNLNDLTMSPIFQSYKSLEEIHVTRSNIPTLGMHFFWGLTKLDVLNLSQNNITQALSHNFRGLSKLKELYLDDNRIYSLPSETFRFLNELKILSIQRNRITALVTSIFQNIGKLKVLKLSGNNLKELNPEVFKDIQELKILECRGCSLTSVNEKIYPSILELIHLDLGQNEIKTISHDEIKDLANLKTFKLDGNQLKHLYDNTFDSQASLRKLNLARNEINKISIKAFQDLHNLTELDLAYNQLETLESGVLQPLANTLEVLILTGNHLQLETLQELLDVELKELYLANCGIAEINSQIFPDTLNTLDLGSNLLSSLPPEVIPLNLNTLNITKNNFRGLDEDILSRFDSIKHIKLENNPWSCDLCHIIPLLERMNRSALYRDIVCMYPYTMKNKKLEMIQRDELYWCTATSYSTTDAKFFFLGEKASIGIIAAATSACLIFFIVLVIIGAWCNSRRHAAKYYTHEDKINRDGEPIYDNSQSPLFCDGELSFKFPLDGSEKRISISTIDEIKKEHSITNGN